LLEKADAAAGQKNRTFSLYLSPSETTPSACRSRKRKRKKGDGSISEAPPEKKTISEKRERNGVLQRRGGTAGHHPGIATSQSTKMAGKLRHFHKMQEVSAVKKGYEGKKQI